MVNYDLTIIGAGWAGFNAALKAKELGLKVLLIDKGKIGGACLNSGCIPTKALIQSAKIFSLTRKSLNFGIDISNPPQINFIKIQERKEKIIQQLRTGMQSLLKGIDFLNVSAKILSPQDLTAGEQTVKTKYILIATGSNPKELVDLKFDRKKILSSDDILNLKEIPQSLLIIGGGVIGCEFASLFSIMGTSVCVVEKMPQLLPGEDSEIAKKLEASFKKREIKVHLNTDAKAVALKDYELVLLCIGRTAQTSDLGLDKLGLKLDRGKIVVDEYLKTSIANIYAAGDCTGKVMLAHNASYQGRIAAGNIASPTNPKKADNTHIPNCIFSEPEIASIGLNETQAKSCGLETRIHKFDFLGSGMARILDETDGFIKLIWDNKTGDILGASIIGPRATELIGILTLAVSARIKVSQIKETIFAHPTLSEGISEAIK